MNLLKVFKPQLLVSADQKLFIQITLGGISVTRPTPDALPRYTEEESRNFFNLVVPQMVKELQALHKDKQRKLKRKAKHAGTKRRRNSSRNNPDTDGREQTATDGKSGI